MKAEKDDANPAVDVSRLYGQQLDHHNIDESRFYDAEFKALALLQSPSLWMNYGLKGIDGFGPSCRALFESLIDKVDGSNIEAVLDVSSGFGDQSLVLADKLPSLKRYVGINPSGFQNQISRYRNPAHTFVTATNESGMDQLVARGQRFDWVISHENAFHFKSRDVFFQQTKALLRDGGYLLMHDIVSAYLSCQDVKRYVGAAGFGDVHVVDISADVHLTPAERTAFYDVDKIMKALAGWRSESDDKTIDSWRYVRVVAVK
jgi:cyclopropane fatty-acyl-phospholipid synthase-like methyltransferase